MPHTRTTPTAPLARSAAVSCLLVFALSAGLYAQPDARPLRGPVVGFVHDSAAGIRPILGVPGSATMGPPALPRAAFESVVVAPTGDYAVAVLARGREVTIVSGLTSAPAAALLDVPAGPARIALSPSGDAAVFYYSETPRVEVVTGLPGAPSRAWNFDLAAMEGGLSVLAVSDGGASILVAAAGVPAPVWLTGPGEGQRLVYTASASLSVAFLAHNEDAVIADGSTGEVVLLRGQRLTRIGGQAEGVSRPVGIAVAPDNRRMFVANAEPGGVVSLDLSGGQPARIDCACQPTTLDPLAGGAVFRLTGPGDGPVWLLDTAGPAPRTVFVPGQPRLLRDAAVPIRETRPSRAPQAALEIGTGAVLPWATLAEGYSQTLAASGGVPPYTWSLASGALPPGITLNASGLLAGTPTQPGPSYFTLAVADRAGASASKAFSLLVILPPTPTISLTGLQDTLQPAEQPEFDVQLSAPYPLEVTGSINLTFEPNAVNSSDDPAVQFSTGGRTLNFTIAAGQTKPVWSSTHALQTGTVAGTIRLKLQFSAGGQNLTPPFAPFRAVTIARAAPKIQSVQVAKTTGGFNLLIKGYSTPREITSATFEFTAAPGGQSQTISVTVDAKSTFNTWYTGGSATAFGSAFLYTQPFTVQGSVSDISSVSVRLSSSSGTSEAATANF